MTTSTKIKTSFDITKQNNFITSPQIDWLTLQINYTNIFDSGNQKFNIKRGKYEVDAERVLILDPNFSYEVMNYGTRIFKRVIEITDKSIGEVVATITDQPISSALNADLVLIKFHNKLLYTDNLKEYILNFCTINGLEIVSISRLDICVDFCQFANRLEPATFIKRFLNGQYIKKGRGKFATSGKYKELNDTDYKAQGSYGQKIQHEYLRFGTNNNGLKYYLYNKTKELEQVKMKPYIVERWKSFNYQKEMGDVWRLEFTIISNDIKFITDTSGQPLQKKTNLIQEKLLIDRKTGEAVEVNEISVKSLECLNIEVLEKIWYSLINKYMVFFANNSTRKTRGKKITLFKNAPNYVAYTCEKSLKDSTNTDKNFIRNLRRTYEDTRHKDINLTENLQHLIKQQIVKRGLEQWAIDKEILNFSLDSPFNYSGSNIPIIQQKRNSEPIKTKKFNKADKPINPINEVFDNLQKQVEAVKRKEAEIQAEIDRQETDRARWLWAKQKPLLPDH